MISFLWRCFIIVTGTTSAAFAGNQSLLSLDDYKHISFPNIPPTTYEISESQLSAAVNRSSSALVRAFPAPLLVRRVSFYYLIDGTLNKTSIAQEQSKAGDDFPFRIGLIEPGPRRMIPVFAPAWIRAVRDHLLEPAGRLVYLVAGSLSPDGTEWLSPYSKSITKIAIPCRKVEGTGQRFCAFEFPAPIPAIGYWLMADGDDTASKFRVEISSLEITTLPREDR